MRKLNLGAVLLVSVSIFPTACVEKLGDDCRNTNTCTPEGGSSGDGDASGGSSSGGKGTGAGGTGGSGGGADTCSPVCSGDASVCDEETKECVECLKTSDCGDALCDTATNTCVECLEANDCLDPATPMCESGACSAGCAVNEDCSRFPETPVCNEDAGSCAACTPATEEAQCDAKSCDPLTFECGPHDRASRGTCRSCVSDSDCESNHHCVPMEYPSGTAREGGYCLELSGSCENPYTVIISGRTTLSDVSGESYCGINEDLTTCEAVKALEGDLRCDSSIEGNVQCWPSAGTIADAVEVPGALCRKFEGVGGERCTYECSVVTDCLESGPAASCGVGTAPAPVTPDFCGGKAN